jgi:hypothetical protein
MIQIIAGEKGKGKTKILISKVNEEILDAKGDVVYLDKNNKHMYELSNKVRLINAKDFMIGNSDEFIGFVCGILSQDSDVEKIYVDSFLNVACIKEEEVEDVFKKLDLVSDRFHVDFIISVSLNKKQIADTLHKDIIFAL